jgi:predicted Zn-dependent protease
VEILRNLAWAACPHGGSPHAARWFLPDGSGWFPAQAWRIRGCSWYLLRGLRRFPDFVPAQKHLASLYAANPEKRGLAYDLEMKARKALPDDPELAEILAELSFQRKEFAYAVQLLQGSSEKKPLDAKLLFYLGMSHLKVNDKLQSREALRQALAAGLPDPLASEAKNVLAELEKG